MSKKSRSTSPPNGKTTEMNGASAADQVLFMGCRRTTQPHNCWIMSFDDPVQLDSESLSRLAAPARSFRVKRVGGLLRARSLFLKEEMR